MIINRSKPINFISTLVISILTIAGFYGCFGGGGGGGGSLSTTTTSGALFTSSGTITGFGSVHVNNTRFITTLATILNDGQLVNQSDLSIGMKVTVRASSSNVASQISFEEDVEGPVDVNDNSGTLTVLGQVVITDASTIFVGGNLAALTPGTVVEVSGFRNGNDEIIATFIELQNNPPNDYEVVGPVRNLDTAAMTFEIGGLTVNYSGANLNDFPNGQSMNGQIVEVEDALLSYVVGSFNLSATEVEPEEPLGGEINPGERVEIENIVTQVISPNSFMLGNLIVITDGNTRFLFGDASQIMVGTRLEVEGIINSGGMLIATKVKFEDNDARVDGTVVAKDNVNSTITMLSPMGVIVTVTPQTTLEDDVTNGAYTFADIMVGHYLEIRGFIVANNMFIATEIERDDPETEASIRGRVTAFDATAGTVTILGVLP